MDLKAVQADLEAYSLAHGQAARATNIEASLRSGALTSDNPYRAILEQHLPSVARHVETLLKGKDGVRGAGRAAYEALSLLRPDVVAACGLSQTFYLACGGQGSWRGADQPTTIAAVVLIAHSLAAQVWSECLKREDIRAYNRLLGKVVPKGGPAYKIKRAAYLAKKEGLEQEPMPASSVVALAEPVLDAVLATGLFVVERGEYDHLCIHLTDETKSLIEHNVSGLIDVARPMWLPMVVPPAPYTSPNTGGYQSDSLRSMSPLLKPYDRGAYKLLEKSFRTGEASGLRDAISALQETRWTINQPVLEAVQVAYEHGWQARKLPTAEAPEVPEVPEDIQSWDEAERKIFWSEYYEAKRFGLEALGNAATMRLTFENANLLKDYPAIYFPHFIDSRGRVYPRPTLNHHRADYVRGILTFADPVPLGEHGKDWLAIHIANNAAGAQYGKLDKEPLHRRIEWTKRNSDLIRGIAQRWREKRSQWADDVDHPFQFLAACFEWEACSSQASADGWGEALSRIPIGLDGTNSGLQHYSAALRSEAEGRLVNLTPSSQPQDVYAAVADAVCVLVADDLLGEDEKEKELARLWQDFGITRSTIKRQVMTFVYGSKAFGFRKQLISDLMRPITKDLRLGKIEKHPLGEDCGKAAAGYLARKVLTAIKAVVPGAARGMEWLQNEARVLAKHDCHMYWRSPLGMPVVHRYHEMDTQRLSLFLTAGSVAFRDLQEGEEKRLRVSYAKQSKRLNKHRQVSAAPPNVIHSLDAAHLQLTALAAKRSGIDSLAMIHDSFGTQAGNTQALSRILREEFVSMYENYDIFHEIRRQSLKVLPADCDELKELPAKGELDISSVLDSLYFFG